MIEIVYESGGLPRRRHNMSPGGNPEQYLRGLWRSNAKWSIDYTNATPQEKVIWRIADVAIRIDRALYEHRPIYINGYRCTTPLWLAVYAHELSIGLGELNVEQDHLNGLMLQGAP